MKNKIGFLGVAVFAVVFALTTTACAGGKTFKNADALRKYLDSQPDNTPDKPIRVRMSLNDLMIKSVVDVLNTAGKYVSLDLSGSPLTTIPDRAFFDVDTRKGCTMLTGIIIPNGVTGIGNEAFVGCTGLTSVTIPNGVTGIGYWAFVGCTGLTSVTIPNSVTSIGNEAFVGCTSLTSVAMSDSVEFIWGGIFEGCTSLPSLPLPKSADASSAVGKIFYYSKAGFTMTDNNEVCHYLEAAPNDMPAKLAWASSGYIRTNISGTDTEFGAGRKNTALILAVDAAAPAAKACRDYSYGGKTDWFLPSAYELGILFRSGNFVGNMGTDYYWSSSQYGSLSYGAWNQYLFTGYHASHAKNNTYSVRAVRAF